MVDKLSDLTGEVSPKTVVVNGVKMALKEFDMRTRGLWLDVAEEYKLSEIQNEIQTEVIPRISAISNNVETDPRVKSIQARLDKLQQKHDAILEVYATDDEPEDVEEQLEAVLTRMERSADELNEMISVVQREVVEGAREAEQRITELMEAQDEARVYFVWQLGRAMGKTDKDFDEFLAGCDSEDYEAADRFLSAGNAPWASLYTDRVQERSKRTRS